MGRGKSSHNGLDFQGKLADGKEDPEWKEKGGEVKCLQENGMTSNRQVFLDWIGLRT